MNRKMKRALQNRFGADFPVDKLLALYSYYASLNLSIEDFVIKLLQNAVETDYLDKKDIIEKRLSEDEEIL